MATRDIIEIDEEKCDGCGDCVVACAEGAIQIIDGKARLVSDVYCDGLGACVGDCPQGALTVMKREAPDFDEAAVEKHLSRGAGAKASPLPCPTGGGGCPSSVMRTMTPQADAGAGPLPLPGSSQLGHWPVQLMLVPPQAPFLQGADLLICADCVPFTVPDFHSRYLQGRAVVVGCPKLDDLSLYYEKFKAIFAQAKPERITVLRMEVPCCGGIAGAVIRARGETAPETPLSVHTIGIQGGFREETIPAGAIGGPPPRIDV
jgi:ferredoxin